MFKADILNMAGGKEADADVREALCVCAETLSQSPETINLCASRNLEKYDNRRIPLILPTDQQTGNLPVDLDWARLQPFSTHKLMDDNSNLVKQLGHLNVKDAATDGSYNNTNLLYNGSNVVEYDLVEKDKRGKYYVFSEPSVLEEIVAAKAEGRFKVKETPHKTGTQFVDNILESSYKTINDFTDEEGHYVSAGKLLTDTMVMMRLYEEETTRVERACVDPAFRRVLASCHDWCESKPLFKVAFITNAALMGLKVVFYPTVLEWDDDGAFGTKDSSKLKSLLKLQLSLLGHCMPDIVRKIEEIKKKYVFCFEIDVRGSSNWNLPGHCKKDPLAFPYHHARLRGPNKNVMEITNTKMVTSLGVVDCPRAREWMYGFLDEFDRRTAYAENLIGVLATAGADADWKRRVLFSDIGPELPFRNKSLFMDCDFCLSGMCYHYLASGQGILLTKRADEEDTNGRIFASVAEDGKGAGASKETDEEEKSRKPPPAPTDIRADVAALYDDMIESKVAALLSYCDQFGMFLADKNTAPGLAMRILTATKATAKKDCVDSLNSSAAFMIKMISRNQKLRHDNLLPFALLQLVLRYECQNMMLPRDNIILCSRMKLRKWSVINFGEVWKLAHEESIKPPSENTLIELPVPSDDDTQQRGDGGGGGGDEISRDAEEDNREGGGIINKMLSTTASTFASGADKKDTMFLWVMVTLAERFCALYNVASNPEEFYNQQCGKLYFEGGLTRFKKMCAALLPELEVYVPKQNNATLRVCRNAIKGYESAVERNKNMTNNKVCKVKMAELKIMHGLNEEFSKCVDLKELSSVTNMIECGNEKVRSALFKPLREEAGRWAKEENAIEEIEEDDHESFFFVPPCFEDNVIQLETRSESETVEGETSPLAKESTVIEKFFNCVNTNRSFKFRTSLCHRQKYVSTSVVREMERELCQLLTLKRVNNVGDTLKEINERNQRMRDWVVPFTMPTDTIDSFKMLSDDTAGPRCNCFQTYSGSSVKGLRSCDKCVMLLVLPPSVPLKSLTVALKCNTMACERRYFGDVSTALGFVPAPFPSSSQTLDFEESRWKSIPLYKCAGSFLKNVYEGGLYENVIKSDSELVNAFKPRTAARKKQAEFKNKFNNPESNKDWGFFSGVWALCADHDLETTVLGSTVTSPFSPTPLLKVTDNERSNLQKKIDTAIDARSFFQIGSLGFFDCFEQMVECMRRTNVSTGEHDNRGDAVFFSELLKKYGKGRVPGAKMWTLFHTVSECFKNSLPVDWNKLIPDWTTSVLNLTEGVSNIDESGAVFELAKFLSVCARSFFGNCLNIALSVDTWERLLREDSWVGKLARAYENALQDNDIRVVENFINSSAFLTNNNITNTLKIAPTENEDIRIGVWKDDEFLEEEKESSSSLQKRAEWLSFTENGTAEHLSFSFVLACVSLFRVTLDGENVKKLAERDQTKIGGVCREVGQLVPLIRGLKITSSWCKSFVANATGDNTMSCINEMRFSSIERDPLYFYRFAGYTIGLIAANDVVLENITRRILDSFDFNGFDTSNWTHFIRHHFTNILLGRRARLLSRPLAFIKNLVGLSTNGRKFMKENTDFEERVGSVISRLAKLILVKSIESESVTVNNILDCCILSDADVTASSLNSLYSSVRCEFEQDKLDYSFSLASNACSNEQLARIKTAARILNCNVSFHDNGSFSNAIDTEEEALIDPSVDVVTPSTAEGQTAVNKLCGKFRRGEDNNNNNNNVDAQKATKSRNSNDHSLASSTSSRIFYYDDGTMDEDGDPSDFEITAKSTKLLNKVKTMLQQRDINIGVIQIINKLKKFLIAHATFNTSEYESYGVKKEVIEAGVEAVARWNAAVENERVKLIKECQELQATGNEYDMSVVTPEDYAKSKNRNCAYAADTMLCKTAPTTFINAFTNQDASAGEFTWLNFHDKTEELSKQDAYNCGGGRLMGYALKDCIKIKNGGIAEIRVLAQEFSYGVKDSYWSAVLPLKSHTAVDKSSPDNLNGKKKGSKEWRGGGSNDSSSTERLVSNLKVNSKIKDVKSMAHYDNLLSLYKADGDETGNEQDNNFRTSDNANDVFVTLGGTSDKYKCLFSLWFCNNGISPKNQIELFKKLLYKNIDVLWIKQYDRHINVLNNWGCLNANNVNNLHFSLSHGNVHAEVTDTIPPLSVFQSRFLSEEDYDYLLRAVEPLVNLKKRMRAEDECNMGDGDWSDSRLLTAVYSREILSSCLDPKGKFCTSSITNSCSVLFTPGTRKETNFKSVSCWDESDPAYTDEDLVGREEETKCRSFVSAALEVTTALSSGVFFQGEKISKDKPAGLTGGRTLRPVNYTDLFIVEQQCNKNPIENTKGAIGVFETASNNNTISETNDCVLLNCQKARCLLMSQRAVLNNTCHKRYDGEVFELSSMRYHAGVSKGFLLDDESDLFSIYGRTNSQKKRKPESEINVISKCADHFTRPNADVSGRVFITDWGLTKGLMELNANSCSVVNATLTPFEMSVVVKTNQNPKVTALRNASPYNRKPIHFGKSDDDLFTACFLANPCGPARRLLQRAPNMRLCVTNAGTALVSRLMEQTARLKNFEEMIMDGSITPFRVTANNSCISVDGNRYFLIDGTYLLGGRIENLNIATDMFTRCKLKSEKHVVYNSLFSSKLVSACLATAIEGTTLSQGLGLLEHVSSMKNSEVSNINHKNFWSFQEDNDVNKENSLTYAPVLSSEGELKPPSVYTNDEDYVLLRIVYEISRAAEHYCQHSLDNADLMTTDKMLKTSSVDTTKAALYATRKCYTACVNQKTGMPRMHNVYFVRALLNFGGFCTAICSGDGEKSHHLIHTLNSVALNMAAKALVMLVGRSGNNLKSTIIDLLKKCWLERFADVNVGVLNSARDSSSSTQTNIAPFAGKKNILVIDEVGYQGTGADTKRGEKEKKEKQIYGDVNEIKLSHGMPSSSMAQDTFAVWEQINSAMIKSKLKICSKECNDIMVARATDIPQPQQPTIKRKRNDEKSNAGDEILKTTTKRRWFLRVEDTPSTAAASPSATVVRVKSFATNAVWWNCMSGTVFHKFNDSKTTFNMMNRGHYPFSVSTFHDSPWLQKTDAIAESCAKPLEMRGKYTIDEINEAAYCLLGDYASSLTPSYYEPLLLLSQDEDVNVIPEEIESWKEKIKDSSYSNGSGRAEQVFIDLVTGDSLLHWTVMNSVDYDDRRPVLSCLPANKMFSQIIKKHLNEEEDIWRMTEKRLDVEEYNFKNTNAMPGGVLYAFHCVHSGCRCDTVSKYKRENKMRKITAIVNDIDEAGPVLSRITPYSIDNINAASRKLSSIIFGGKSQHDVDEDNYLNAEREYDMALFSIMEKPWCASFPKITTDGSSVMNTSKEDCKGVLLHIKKTIIDAGRLTNTGSFISLCLENNLLDNLEQVPQPSSSRVCSIFGDVASMFSSQPAPSKNDEAVPPLKARSKKLMSSLIKFKSDGRTMAISEIASAVASKSDANTAITKHMLPGQFNSNLIKKMTSKGSSIHLRSVYSKPVMSSFTMTPIMTSNSYLFTFFVDEALSKRMVTFPCETQFVFKSKNDDAQNFVTLVDSGLKSVHVLLNLERQAKLKKLGNEQAPEDVKAVELLANKWLSVWNESVQHGMNTDENVSDLSSVAALLPARALQLLVKNCVLEHRDALTMFKLEANANTFLHMYTTFTLSSKSESSIAKRDFNTAPEEECNDDDDNDDDNDGDDDGDDDDNAKRQIIPLASLKRKRPEKPAFFSFKKQSRKPSKPLQMCQVNPKSLNTMAMAITRSRQGAWAKINTALNCVMFVDTPFVRTSRLFGEDCNLKMFVPEVEGVIPAIHLDWCIGLKMPNPDMDVRGYDKEGAMIGAGAAIMKQVCDAWGSTDLKTVMYSCHHLHMLFELVLQFSRPKSKISGLCSIRNNNRAGMDYVAVLFACLIYKEMMGKLRYSVFLNEKKESKKQRSELQGLSKPLEIPMFVSMVINKPLAALRFTTNLSNLSKTGAREHSEMIKCITSQLGQKLNPEYLCPNCCCCKKNVA